MYRYVVKILISTLLIWISSMVIASADSSTVSNQAGTIDDPVITKSYFEQNIKLKVAEEMNKQTINESKVKEIVASELAAIKQTPAPASPSTTTDSNSKPNIPDASNPASTSPAALKIINLDPGQSLYGGSGTEIIVRTGKVTVVSSDESGIPDVTSGKDIAAGATVDLNHLLIIPRDGRGIKADAKLKQDVYIMVRGTYLITNADGSKVTS
jgi:hypothetical protein